VPLTWPVIEVSCNLATIVSSAKSRHPWPHRLPNRQYNLASVSGDSARRRRL